MSLTTEPWHADRHDKVAKIARAMGQSIGKRMNKDTFRIFFPEKKDKDGNDIGLICCDWAYKILTDLDNNKSLIRKLMSMIVVAYLKGKNLNEWTPWKYYLLIYGYTTLPDKLDKFPHITNLSFMDKLDKEELGKTIEDVQW